MKLIPAFPPPFVLALCVVAFASPVQAAQRSSETALAAKAIHLRRAATLKSPVAGELAAGEAVAILRQRGEFAEVRRADGRTGYVKRKYLAMPALASTAAALPPETKAEAGAGVARVPPVQPGAETGEPSSTAPVAPTVATPVAAPSGVVRRRIYGRLTAGLGFVAQSPEHFQRGLNTAGGTVTLREINTVVPTFALDAGYRLSEHFFAEAGVLDLGAYQGRIDATGANPARLKQVLRDHYPAGGLGGTLSVGAMQARGDWHFAAAGGAFCSFDRSHTFNINGARLSVDHDACAPLLTARVGKALAADWSLGLTTQAVFFDNPQFTVGLALQYR